VSLQSSSKLRSLRWLIAGATAALWLLTGFLAVSPHWHHCLHEDSQGAEHQCFLTKYSDGQVVFGPDATVRVAPAEELATASQCFRTAPKSSLALLLPPGRAPPLL